ncbi:MAG: hypothetical protein EOP48_27095 [Sphingobacteriales bacterium]|nr:MAG: hypothetical protein EOP48_27095 [Sphingobacteriales bacterium]
MEKENFFKDYLLEVKEGLSPSELEEKFKESAINHGFKAGELMLPFRIMLVGGKFGPGVFDISVALGADETRRRIELALTNFK